MSRIDQLLDDGSFVARCKQSARDFTRDRVLTFRTMVVLMLIKGNKSLQLSMNNFLPKLGRTYAAADKSAYSRARRKLKATTFMVLNQEAVVRTMYEDGDYQTFQDLRILAIDGSKVQLPTNPETIEAFGTFAYRSQRPNSEGQHAYALASVLYDVLNRVAVDAVLAPAHSYEVELAKDHLSHTQSDDLVIYDRGYCSFRMLVLASQADGHFLVRCTSRSFTVANTMLTGEGPDDIVCEITANHKFLENPENKGLPKTLTVRFVRVTLDTGEYEVLVTSLLDQQQYPTVSFKELYYLRWGIETFYGILKTRLGLENFSGYSPEAIRQDFFATIFLTGAETILTEDAAAALRKQRGGHPKQVNKAVSFNLIKEHAFELFYSKAPDEARLEELTQLFMTSPTLRRKDRQPPRNHPSSHRVLGFWKRQRKMVF